MTGIFRENRFFGSTLFFLPGSAADAIGYQPSCVGTDDPPLRGPAAGAFPPTPYAPLMGPIFARPLGFSTTEDSSALNVSDSCKRECSRRQAPARGWEAPQKWFPSSPPAPK